jgi:hypothetical protein
MAKPKEYMRTYREKKKAQQQEANKQEQKNNESTKQWSDEKVENYWNAGLDARRTTNKYITMNRVSDDGEKIVVNVADEHLIETRYGYGLILDDSHVVWLKDNQVSQNYYGNEVILNKKYFNPKKWGDFSNKFGADSENLSFESWKNVAIKQQRAGREVKWEDHYYSAKAKAIIKNIAKR